MQAETWKRVEELFRAAQEQSADKRAEFLKRACPDDAQVRAEVQSLLDAESAADSFLESSPISAPVVQPVLVAGRKLGGFEILELIGKGGMGEVYRARDMRLKRDVAIKVLTQGVLRDDQRARKRLIEEARAASALDHPNVITVHAIEEDAGLTFLVTEYIHGETLSNLLRRGPMDFGQVVELGIHVADALATAHARGMIHRDIKPGNIMITSRGVPKVLDFGLSKPAAGVSLATLNTTLTASMSHPGAIIGTLSFMSPEQARGESLDARSDVFSLALVLYEAATGKLPFRAANLLSLLHEITAVTPPHPSSINPHIPPQFDVIIERALAKDKEQRYSSASEFGEALKSLQFASTTNIARQSKLTRVKSFVRRRYVIPAAVLLILSSGTAIWVHARRPSLAKIHQPAIVKQANVASNAYDSYLRGKFLLRGDKQTDNLAAIAALKHATEADPSFAKAFAVLALAYTDRLFFVSPAERKELEEEAWVAAEKAASLDPNLAEIYIARARLLWTPANHFPHERAAQEARHAVNLDPNSDEAHNQLAQIYNHIGLFDKALEEARRAAASNPSAAPPVFQIGHALLLQGDWEQAVRVYQSIPEDDLPEVVGSHLAWAFLQLGRKSEASALVSRYLKDYPSDPGGVLTGMQALLFAAADDKERAQDAIAKASKKDEYGHFHHTAYWIASAFARMNNREAAMHWLQETVDKGFPCYPLFLHDPNLNSLRADPQFAQFMESLKRQWEYYKTHL